MPHLPVLHPLEHNSPAPHSQWALQPLYLPAHTRVTVILRLAFGLGLGFGFRVWVWVRARVRVWVRDPAAFPMGATAFVLARNGIGVGIRVRVLMRVRVTARNGLKLR